MTPFNRGRFALVTAPASEPITLAEAKAHLRVETAFEADDDPIALLLQAARELCEAEVDRSFVNTTWDYVVDRFPSFAEGTFLRIPKADLVSVTSLSYVDAAAASQSLTEGVGFAARIGPGGGVYPYQGTTWPTTHSERLGCVTVRCVVGFGATAASVPAAVKAAILLTLGHLYEHRGDGADQLPASARAVLSAQRWGVL